MSIRRERGRVHWYKADKGYGRIASEEFGDLLFVHFSSITGEGFRMLTEGQAVEYTRTIQPGPHGQRATATDVVVVRPEQISS
jgi:cold shock CspA family protein